MVSTSTYTLSLKKKKHVSFSCVLYFDTYVSIFVFDGWCILYLKFVCQQCYVSAFILTTTAVSNSKNSPASLSQSVRSGSFVIQVYHFPALQHSSTPTALKSQINPGYLILRSQQHHHQQKKKKLQKSAKKKTTKKIEFSQLALYALKLLCCCCLYNTVAYN